jgi:hypothetical protein
MNREIVSIATAVFWGQKVKFCSVIPGWRVASRWLRLSLVFVITCFVFFFTTSGVQAHFQVQLNNNDEALEEIGERVTPQVIMIMLDKITLQDLELYAGPFLASIIEQSGIALMNVNTAGSLGTEGGYLSIGSGARLLGNSLARVAFNRDESYLGYPVEEIYRRHMGRDELPDGEILHLYPETLAQLNGNLLYPSLLGALGESLKAGGYHTAVLGNADTDREGRQAVTVAMDAEGAVTYGNVGSNLLREDGGFPFGHRSDAGAYLEAFEVVCKKASLIVVEWGDTARLESYLGRLPEQRRGELLESSLRELDIFLSGLKPYFHRGVKLFFVVPSPANQAYTRGQRLTPLIIYEPGLKQKGLLISSSTRRPGITTNIDLVPTILEHLKVSSPVFLWGAPLKVVPTANHLLKMSQLSERTVLIYSQRPRIVKAYITYQIIALLVGLVMVLFRLKFVQKIRFAYYFLLYLPPAILLAPAFPFFPSPSFLKNTLLIIVLAALLTLIAARLFKETLTFFAFTGLFIFSLLLLDLLHGAALNSRSFLGYDPLGGARFYGMGNEYMGILIGSLILGFGSLCSLLLRKFPQPEQKEGTPPPFLLKVIRANRLSLLLTLGLFAVFSLLVIFMMASPNYGANFGGAITAGVALAVTWKGLLTLFYKRKPELKVAPEHKKKTLLPLRIVLPALFLLATTALLYYLNLSHTGETVSHLGRTLDLVRSNGLQELWNVILRKTGMNLKLLRWSLWSRALVLLLSLIVILNYYPVGLVRKILQREAGFRVLLGGITAGSIGAFFVNDSGVIAAATTLFYGALPLLLLAIREVDA